MAAPSATVRVAPTGIKMKEGFSIKHTFAADTDISIWERVVAMPSVDGGEAIDHSDQHNTAWEPVRPRVLKKQQPYTVKGLYDPDLYNQIIALINVETTCTQTLPDGSTLASFGYLQKAEFDPLEKGKEPEVTLTIVPTMWDPTNRVEAGPVLTSVSGT